VLDPEHGVMTDQRVRDGQLAVLTELAIDYNTDGVELDLSCGPGGSSPVLRPEEAAEYAPVITEWLRSVTDVVHNRPAGRGVVGVRVYPTPQMNARLGLEVDRWITEGLIDYVVPMLYLFFTLDPCLDISWAVSAAATADTQGQTTAVYGMLQPYLSPDGGGALAWNAEEDLYPHLQHFRAAAANLYAQGADGVYSYLARWPHDESVFSMLREVSPRRQAALRLADKRYRLVEHDMDVAENLAKAGLPEYPWSLPLEIHEANPSQVYQVPFFCADKLGHDSSSSRRVSLYCTIDNLCSEDDLAISINSLSLASEPVHRTYGLHHARMLGAARTSTRAPTSGGPGLAMAIVIELRSVGLWPRHGHNLLGFCLRGRPIGLGGGVRVHKVELRVEYSPYPSRL
jgi:hypothetical protein